MGGLWAKNILLQPEVETEEYESLEISLEPNDIHALELDKAKGEKMVMSRTIAKGPDKGKVISPSTTIQKAKVKSRVAMIQMPKPNIVVQSLSYTRPQGRKVGEPFYEGEGTTLAISFRNIGKAKSDKDDKYTISCLVKSGGPEGPVKNETKPFRKEIAPNDTALRLLSVTLKKAGEYDITVKVIGDHSVSQKTVKLKVAKKRQVQPMPESKTKRVVPVPESKTKRVVPVPESKTKRVVPVHK